jgi:hypothetical protein
VPQHQRAGLNHEAVGQRGQGTGEARVPWSDAIGDHRIRYQEKQGASAFKAWQSQAIGGHRIWHQKIKTCLQVVTQRGYMAQTYSLGWQRECAVISDSMFQHGRIWGIPKATKQGEQAIRMIILGTQHGKAVGGCEPGYKRPCFWTDASREIIGPGYTPGPRTVMERIGGACSRRDTQPGDRCGKKGSMLPALLMGERKQESEESSSRATLGIKAKNVAPRTKPKPRWCPSGLTRMQCRRVQKLRANEIKEKEKEVARDLWFNQEQPLTKLEGDEQANMEINMVFHLPVQFELLEQEVARLDLGAKRAMFEKPEEIRGYMKPLYIQGHLDGVPVDQMLVDGGACVNIMPCTLFEKLSHKEEELMRTNMTLSGFSGKVNKAKGIILKELTVGSKTVPTAFFVVDVKGMYNILLG